LEGTLILAAGRMPLKAFLPAFASFVDLILIVPSLEQFLNA